MYVAARGYKLQPETETEKKTTTYLNFDVFLCTVTKETWCFMLEITHLGFLTVRKPPGGN